MTDVGNELARPVTLLVPAGMLGSGIQARHVRYGIERGADGIAVDSGSTDSGASYLARGVPKQTRESIKRDLSILVAEAAQAKIPLLVGTCGFSGADPGVEWTRDIVLEIAREQGLNPKIACLFSEQSKAVLRKKNAAGKVTPLKPSAPADDALLDSCDRIVALMGPEPYIEALRDGADIILGGRTSDPAVLAALPLSRGIPPALAWHAAKITECGGMCTVGSGGGGVLVTLRSDNFEVEPLEPENSCTPQTVSAHMLYENSNPFVLVEPGGILDVTTAEYTAVDPRVTRVRGAVWNPMPYTMKLEGARGGPFQTVMLVGIENPEVLANVDAFLERMQAMLVQRATTVLGDEAGDFDISLRAYGWNGVSGRTGPPRKSNTTPAELGLMFVATARTQDLATKIAKICNSTFFHLPLEPGMPIPAYAFPFSPAEMPRGQVYEFVLNHVVHVDHALELVRREWVDLSCEKEVACA